MKNKNIFDWQSVDVVLMWKVPHEIYTTAEIYTKLWGLIQTINTTNAELQAQLQDTTTQHSPFLQKIFTDKQRLYPSDDFPLIAFHPTALNYQQCSLKPDTPFYLTLVFGGEFAHLAEQWFTWFCHRLTLENTGFDYLCSTWQQHRATLPTQISKSYDLHQELNFYFDLPANFELKHQPDSLSTVESFKLSFIQSLKKRLIQWFPSQTASIKSWFTTHHSTLLESAIHFYQLRPQHKIKTVSKSTTSQHQHEQLQFHQGFVGWLTLKQAWTQLNDIWTIFSSIHFLGQRTKINGLGYAMPQHLISITPPTLWQKWTKLSYIHQIVADVLTQYDLEPVIDETGQLMQQQTISQQLYQQLQQNQYQPQPTLATLIPTSSGRVRRIEQLQQLDFIVHRLFAYGLTPILDQYFSPHSLGYRKGYSRSRIQTKIQTLVNQGFQWVIECDIADFFNQLPLSLLWQQLSQLLPEREHQSIEFIKKLMEVDYILDEQSFNREKGLIQGSPLSPVLANFYLSHIDEALQDENICFVRYADDILIFCREYENVDSIVKHLEHLLSNLGLSLNIEKNNIINIEKGFEFLGFYFDRDGHHDKQAVAHLAQKKPLVIMGEHKYLKLNGSAIEIRQTLFQQKEKLSSSSSQLLNIVPLRRIEQLLIFGQHHISTPLLSACAKHHVSVHFVNHYGFQSSTFMPSHAEFFAISAKQYIEHTKLTPHERLSIACDLVGAKIHNYQLWIKHSYREHDSEYIQQLEHIKQNLTASTDIAQLMGYEGQASKLCFHRLQRCIISEQRTAFSSKRRQRGGKDRLNSLLNFGYYWLFTRISSLVRSHGLNPYLSFLHEPEQDYETLVYDLMEPFRVFVDRTVLRLLNRKQIQARDFQLHEQKGWQLCNSAIRLYSAELEATLNQTVDECILDDVLLVQIRLIQQWATQKKSLTWFYWQGSVKF